MDVLADIRVTRGMFNECLEAIREMIWCGIWEVVNVVLFNWFVDIA